MSPRLLLLCASLLGVAACTSTQTSGSGGDGASGAAPAAEAASEAGVDDGTPVAPVPVDGDGGADVNSVVMIGDSITVASLPALEEEFSALGYGDARIEAQVGKRIASNSSGNPSGVAVAGDLLDEIENNGDFDHSDALWVIALGTNDINQYSESSDMVEVVDEILDVVPDEAKVLWVDTYHGGDTDGSDFVNSGIETRLAVRDSSYIARWSAAATDEENLRSDLIHPSDEGTVTFAAVVAAAVADATR